MDGNAPKVEETESLIQNEYIPGESVKNSDREKNPNSPSELKNLCYKDMDNNINNFLESSPPQPQGTAASDSVKDIQMCTLTPSQDPNQPHTLTSHPPEFPTNAEPHSSDEVPSGSPLHRLDPAPDFGGFPAPAQPSVVSMETGESSVPASNGVHTLELRGYQQEVSERILKGENDIIILPTGTGKTFVALNLMIKHIDLRSRESPQNRKCKILFTTPNRVVANQHAEWIKKYLPQVQCRKIVGGDIRGGAPELQEILEGEQYPIVVLTPQLIINYLLAFPDESSLTKFSLIIADECHAAGVNGQPLRSLLMRYHEDLMNGVDSVHLPQLVGMTATIGIGQAKNTSAKEHVRKLCVLFDLKHPPTEVIQFKQELEAKTAKPERRIREVIPDKNLKNRFIGKLSEIITNLHGYLKDQLMKSEAIGLKLIGREVSVTTTTSFLPTLNRCSDYMDDIVAQHDYQSREEAMRSIKALKQIKAYADARYLADMSECSTALELLETFMEAPNRGREIQHISPYTDYEQKWKPQLVDLATKQDDQGNIKLDMLKVALEEIFEKDQNSKVMLFVARRDLCRIISDWIERLKPLYKPHRFISTRENSGTDKIMSEDEQREVLEQFRKGELNILVSTSIGELGLDIPDCNATITYIDIKNSASAIQVEGRSRMLNGLSYYILTPDNAERLKRFSTDEDTQKRALSEIRAEADRGEFLRSLESIRKDIHANIEYQRKQEMDNGAKERRMEILCGQCGSVLSNLDKIKNYLESAFVVIDGSLEEKLYCIRGGKDVDYILDGMEVFGRMYCKQKEGDCNNHVGKIFTMNNRHLPRWKLEKIRLKGWNERKPKWNKIRKEYCVERIGYNRLVELIEAETSEIEVRTPHEPLNEEPLLM